MAADDSEIAFDLAAEYVSGDCKDLSAICANRPELRERVESILRAGGQLAKAAERSPKPEIEAEAMPEMLGRYKLITRLGEGAMGVAFRGRDPELNREVAIKLLRNAANVPSAALRFLDEARITAQLQHPTIPAVHEIGTHIDGRPWMAMKLIKGVTLLNLSLEKSSAISRFALFESICQGLSYAHSKGVIHRDLKPNNIMVGAFGEVQIMDWGLAKVLTDNSANTKAYDDAENSLIDSNRDDDAAMTRAGTALGSPAYMPPEQAIGAVNKIDRRSDVFGLGAVLCHLLTGQPPFVGANAESTRQLAAMGKLSDAFARLDASGADPEWIALCKKCLASEQDERPSDASKVCEIAAELRAAADERARSAEIEKGKIEVRMESERKRRLATFLSATVIVVTLFTGLGVSISQMFRAREAEEKANQDRDEKEKALAIATKAEQSEAEARAKADASRNNARQSVDTAVDAIIERAMLDKQNNGLSLFELDFLKRSLTDYQQRIDELKGDDNSNLVIGELLYRKAIIQNKLEKDTEAEADLNASEKMLKQLSLSNLVPVKCWTLLAEIQRTRGQLTSNSETILRHRQEELRLRRKLADRLSQDTDWLLRTSECLEKIVETMDDKAEQNKFVEYCNQAIEYRERLTRIHHSDHRNYYAAINTCLVVLNSSSGKTNEAFVRKALDLCTSGLVKFPKGPDAKDKWALAIDDLLVHISGRRVTPLRKILFELRLAIAEEDGGSDNILYDLETTIIDYCNALIEENNQKESRIVFDKAIKFLQSREPSKEDGFNMGLFYSTLSRSLNDKAMASESYRLAVKSNVSELKQSGRKFASVNNLTQSRLDFGKHLLQKFQDIEGAVREFKLALKELDQLSKDKNDEPQLVTKKATIYNELRHALFGMNPNESLKYAELAVELQPNISIYRFYLAKHFYDMRLYEKAIPHAKEAVRLGPTFAEAHGVLGLILFKTGDIPGALVAFSKAKEIDSNRKNNPNRIKKR